MRTISTVLFATDFRIFCYANLSTKVEGENGLCNWRWGTGREVDSIIKLLSTNMITYISKLYFPKSPSKIRNKMRDSISSVYINSSRVDKY